MEHQAKILRVLEDGKIRRVGGKNAYPVDTRIIAATNRDLYAMVMDGQFREDLYFRLREFLIRTPALRDRPEDIPLLAEHCWGQDRRGWEEGASPEKSWMISKHMAGWVM